MSNALSNAGPPAFYTVREAARILRVDPSTLYRAIREDALSRRPGPYPLRRSRRRAGSQRRSSSAAELTPRAWLPSGAPLVRSSVSAEVRRGDLR
jgi:hypothetical protein